jgi:WD40 repeat protein
VAFNAFHDQLVLSGGSDGRVNLWRASSVSSAPLLELGDEEIFAAEQVQGSGHRKAEPKLAPDTAIRSHEEHEDSVYAACWSASTAWVYASLSYQGRLLVAQVPSADKYRILL